ncbi:MAG: tetratricopeptide repeat protein [Clostridiaceae bacterium]|nr:tetratricopeptide repeat protein [Clostridiaceae bacterium]
MSKIDKKIEGAKELFEEKKFDQVLTILESLSNKKLIKKQKFEVKLLQGVVRMNLNQYDESKKDLYEALEQAEDNENLWQQTRALHQLGIIMKLLGDYPLATEYFREELRRCSSLIPSYYSDLSYNFYEQGDVMMLSGNYEDAEMYFNHAYTFANTERNHHGIALAMEALGNLNLHLDRNANVIEYFQKSVENFKKAEAFDEAEAVQSKIDELTD